MPNATAAINKAATAISTATAAISKAFTAISRATAAVHCNRRHRRINHHRRHHYIFSVITDNLRIVATIITTTNASY
jgi:hypothetical protein